MGSNSFTIISLCLLSRQILLSLIWQTLNPFQTTEKEFLWRASVPSTSSKIANTVAIDCCGNRRWIVSEHKPDLAQMKIEQGLKKVFDPHGIYQLC
jgi:glycolate oxidase FAD binding subunit